jgi:Ca2+/Na+ antiporter
MKQGLRVAFVPVVLTVLFAVLLAAGALTVTKAVAIWLLGLAVFLLVRFVREVRAADADRRSRRFDAALRERKTKVSIPGELLRMERVLGMGVATAGDSHRVLLPLLRTAAAARLASTYGIDLMRSPASAQARLGDDAWDWLRPDRPPPDDRLGPGVPRAVAEMLITRVESL